MLEMIGRDNLQDVLLLTSQYTRARETAEVTYLATWTYLCHLILALMYMTNFTYIYTYVCDVRTYVLVGVSEGDKTH
jgi:phosphohistidine phosphatase SixA